MHWIYSIVLWLVGWVLCIILRVSAVHSSSINDLEKTALEMYDREFIANGNNLFATGIVYCGASVLCAYLKIDWIVWIILAVLAVFCIPPVFSFFQTFYMHRREFYKIRNIFLFLLSTFICDFVPLGILLNILITRVLK